MNDFLKKLEAQVSALNEREKQIESMSSDGGYRIWWQKDGTTIFQFMFDSVMNPIHAHKLNQFGDVSDWKMQEVYYVPAIAYKAKITGEHDSLQDNEEFDKHLYLVEFTRTRYTAFCNHMLQNAVENEDIETFNQMYMPDIEGGFTSENTYATALTRSGSKAQTTFTYKHTKWTLAEKEEFKKRVDTILEKYPYDVESATNYLAYMNAYPFEEKVSLDEAIERIQERKNSDNASEGVGTTNLTDVEEEY